MLGQRVQVRLELARVMHPVDRHGVADDVQIAGGSRRAASGRDPRCRHPDVPLPSGTSQSNAGVPLGTSVRTGARRCRPRPACAHTVAGDAATHRKQLPGERQSFVRSQRAALLRQERSQEHGRVRPRNRGRTFVADAPRHRSRGRCGHALRSRLRRGASGCRNAGSSNRTPPARSGRWRSVIR